MKLPIAVLFFLVVGWSFGQDPWKNIYSQHAWAERDRWQKPEALIEWMDITPGGKVADVGSHEGYMTFKLAKVVGANGMVYAVDVEAGKLEKVQKRAEDNHLPQIRTIRGHYDDPKLPVNALDAVIILDTYHEMDAHDEILAHIRNSLKKTGRLVLCEPIADDRRGLSRVEQERKHELAMAFALDDLKKAGFRILFQKDPYIDRTREKGDKMWLVVAGKE